METVKHNSEIPDVKGLRNDTASDFYGDFLSENIVITGTSNKKFRFLMVRFEFVHSHPVQLVQLYIVCIQMMVNFVFPDDGSNAACVQNKE